MPAPAAARKAVDDPPERLDRAGELLRGLAQAAHARVEYLERGLEVREALGQRAQALLELAEAAQRLVEVGEARQRVRELGEPLDRAAPLGQAVQRALVGEQPLQRPAGRERAAERLVVARQIASCSMRDSGPSGAPSRPSCAIAPSSASSTSIRSA